MKEQVIEPALQLVGAEANPGVGVRVATLPFPRQKGRATLDKTTRRRILSSVALVVSLLLLAGLGWELIRNQNYSEQSVLDRFRIRADIAAKFLAAYTNELLKRERVEATAELNGDISPQQFSRFSKLLGFSAAVLLDESGRLLAVEPPSPALLGVEIGSEYAHLRAALQGRLAVSNVVSSAALSVPVVGFAVPVDTNRGRRVYSGALTVADTTVGKNFLQNTLPFAGARVYLVDEKAVTIASSHDGAQVADLMQRQDLTLWESIASANEGRYERAGAAERFAVASVEGTPWRLVISAPESELMGAVAGPMRWILDYSS